MGRKDLKNYSFVMMCLLLVSTWNAYCSDTSEAKFTNPTNGAVVLKNASVELSLRNISAGNLWICVYPIEVKRFYVQDKRYLITEDMTGHFYTRAFVGNDNEWSSKFKLLAVVANDSANYAIIEYLTKSNTMDSWSGLEKLPEGALILDTVNVTRA